MPLTPPALRGSRARLPLRHQLTVSHLCPVFRRLTLFKQFFAAGAKLALPSSALGAVAGSALAPASPSPAGAVPAAPPAEAAAAPTTAAFSSVPVVPGVAAMPPTTRARGANSVLPVPPGLTGAPLAPEIEAERGEHAAALAWQPLLAPGLQL